MEEKDEHNPHRLLLLPIIPPQNDICREQQFFVEHAKGKEEPWKFDRPSLFY